MWLNKGLFWLVLLGMVVVTYRADSGEFPVYKVIKTTHPPVIDGNLTDSCWKRTKKASGFVQIITGEGLAPVQTTFSILQDKENLYLGIECQEPAMRKMKRQKTEHDSNVYEDDCVEIFFDPGQTTTGYYHFIVNSLGTQYEAESILGKVWDSFWRVGTRGDKNKWTVEMAIPFASLGQVPQEGDMWGFNIGRERYAEGLEVSTWSLTRLGFHDPTNFGLLVFQSYQTWLQKNFFKEWLEAKKEMLRLLNSPYLDAKKEKEKEFERIVESLDTVVFSLRPEVDLSDSQFGIVYPQIKDGLDRLRKLKYTAEISAILNEGTM